MESGAYRRRQAKQPDLLTVQIMQLNPDLDSPLQFISTFMCVLSCHEQNIIILFCKWQNNGVEEWNDMLRAT